MPALHQVPTALVGMPEEENEALVAIALSIYTGLGCIKSVELEAFSLWWSCINFHGIDDVQEPFISWLKANHERLHADTRSELLDLGKEVLNLLKGHAPAERTRSDA